MEQKLSIRDKERLVQEIINQMKEKIGSAELFLPEVEKCIFIELMKLDENVLKTQMEKL